MSGFISRCRVLGLAGAILAVLFVASPVFAQNVIKGKVLDKDGNPVDEAKVTITSTENSRKFELKTDKKGEYYQIGIPTGRYNVTVEKDKLGKLENQANVRGGQPTNVDFKFVPGVAGLSEEQKAKNSALQKLFDEGIAASQGGNHDGAVAKFTEVAAGMQNCADCYYNIGTEYTALKKYPEAETAFKKAIELKPDHTESYNGLANVYNAQKKFDLASQASAKATELSAGAAGGGSAESLYNQGVISWNAGKTDEAKTQFQAALKVDPNHAPSHFQLGMAYLNLGQLPEAKAEFETYLKLAPTGPQAAQAQGMINALPK